MTADELIERMQELRMYVVICLPDRYGSRTEHIPLDHLLTFIESSNEMIAGMYDISVDDYCAWRLTKGSNYRAGRLTCGAICRDGQVCGNTVYEELAPDEWVELRAQGRFCAQHRRRQYKRKVKAA